MPTYQYVCASCGGAFEKKLPMSQASERQSCVVCGSAETRKRLGAVAVQGMQSISAETAQPLRSPFT